MEDHRRLLEAATSLQDKVARDKAAEKTHGGAQESKPRQGFDAPQDAPGSNEVDGEGESKIVEAASRSQIDKAIWESDNAGLEDEFSALEATLSSYVDLQTRIFHDLGGADASHTGAGRMDAERVNFRGAYSRGLVLSDALRYIQYLEGLQQDLVEEKSVLETKVSSWERKGCADGATV